MSNPIIINGVDVRECKHHRKCILPDNIGCKIDDFLCCDKPNCYYKQSARKTQECENLKAEEKYLKQCCQKAGEELAKHSFEYDGKEKNLVVQAMELNEKYEKFKNALEEIEEVWAKDEDGDYDFIKWQILNIINKAKGETNAK